MRKFVGGLIGAAAVITLVGCSSTTAFKDQAADFLEEDDQVESTLGQKFVDATCEEPENTDVGTLFSCTATGDSDGVEYVFGMEITADKEFTLQSAEPAG